MHEVVYRLMSRLCALVEPVPVGTNLDLVMVFWMLVTGQLLGTRGAVVPALSASGLAPPAVRRARPAEWAGAGARGGAASGRRCARGRCGLRRAAAAGGRGHGLGRPRAQELHRPAGDAPALCGSRPAPHARRPGAAPGPAPPRAA